MQFQVNIEEIREKGLDYARELPADFVEGVVGQDGEAGFHARGASQFKGRFEKLADRVLLHAKLDLHLKSPCKRCLAEVRTDLPVQFDLSFVKDAPASGADDEDDAEDDAEGQSASFDPDEVDVERFDGQRIELDPVLREQMLLALPMDTLCKPDCKGLCMVCGQDRNQADCGHEQKVPDPRWSALKNIKLPN